MIEAVIFDVDGTLVDSVDLHAECWQRAFEKFGKPLPFDQVRRQIGKGGDQLIPSLLSPEEDKAFGEQLDKFRSELWKKEYAARVKPFPCVRELFVALKKGGVKIALGSSAKKEELESYEKLMNVQDLVDVRTTSDDADQSKPEPDIFDATIKKLRSKRANTRVVGDTPYDVRAATRANLECIGVLCGGFPEAELAAVGAKAIFRDPCELLATLDRWAGER